MSFQKNPRRVCGGFMFTGIISHLGKLKSKRNAVFTFRAEKSFCRKIKKGTSIAVNGVCLTVTQNALASFTVEIMPETKRRTMLGNLEVGSLVNLELPATPQNFLSGHIVQGHIDSVGTVKRIVPQGNSRILIISIPKTLNKYLVEKGSVAVNGISLTIINAKPGFFTVGIIPYTWRHTSLQEIKVGDLVNLEVDILAKYLEKLSGQRYEKY